MIYFKETKSGDLHKRAGVIITDGRLILGALPSSSPKYKNNDRRLDIPKGHIEKGETPIQAACRECYEETSLLVQEKELELLGKYTLYNEPFYLYIYKTSIMPNIAHLKCLSTFTDETIEVDEQFLFEYVPISKISERLLKDLVPILKANIKEIANTTF